MAANFTLTDQGTPSSSSADLGRPGFLLDTPADPVKLIVLFPDVGWNAASLAARHVDLLWGIVAAYCN